MLHIVAETNHGSCEVVYSEYWYFSLDPPDLCSVDGLWSDGCSFGPLMNSAEMYLVLLNFDNK